MDFHPVPFFVQRDRRDPTQWRASRRSRPVLLLRARGSIEGGAVSQALDVGPIGSQRRGPIGFQVDRIVMRRFQVARRRRGRPGCCAVDRGAAQRSFESCGAVDSEDAGPRDSTFDDDVQARSQVGSVHGRVSGNEFEIQTDQARSPGTAAEITLDRDDAQSASVGDPVRNGRVAGQRPRFLIEVDPRCDQGIGFISQAVDDDPLTKLRGLVQQARTALGLFLEPDSLSCDFEFASAGGDASHFAGESGMELNLIGDEPVRVLHRMDPYDHSDAEQVPARAIVGRLSQDLIGQPDFEAIDAQTVHAGGLVRALVVTTIGDRAEDSGSPNPAFRVVAL